VRALFEQRLLPLASGVDAAFVALWLHTFRSFTTPLAFDCLVDRFGKPRRRFNALAPLDAPQRLTAQRDRVAHAHPGLLRSRLVAAAALRERLSRPTASCLPTRRAVGGSAPTFADSLAVWYRVSPGETALPFHRKRSAYEAPTKRMLKYCGVELDPKNRTLLDYHPVEVERQNGAGARRLCARATERADVARLVEGRGRCAHARLPEHQAHQTSSTASAAGWRRK
jgi:hypothetical protein